MSHRPHLDRYQRLASQLPMRDPVAGPDQLRTLGPRALVGALQAEPATGRRSSMRPRKPGRSTSTTSRTSILRSTSETKGGSRSAACRATGIGVVPEVRGA